MEMGFVFGYNGTLGDSESVDISQIDKIDRRKRNHDDTFLSVRCDGCDTYMDFYPGVKDGHMQCFTKLVALMSPPWLLITRRCFLSQQQ